MAPVRACVPNIRLQERRARAHLTQEAVAEELARLAWVHQGIRVGVNADMVGKWERGEKRPSKFYRRLLCLLYECLAEELGWWEPGGTSELRRIGGLVVPPPGFGGRWPERPLHVSEATVHNLESVTAAYRRMYHTVAAHDLIDDVAQHAQTTAGFWRRTADPELRRSLAAAASEITMLAGRMSFFDRPAFPGRAVLPRRPRGCPGRRGPADAGRRARQQELPAPQSRGLRVRPAAPRPGEAARARRPRGPVVGDGPGSDDPSLAQEPTQSLATLEAAETVLDDATPGAAPAWFDYYDRPRLAGFKGQVHIRLAQPETAHAVLEEAMGALDPDAAKQRACYLADQATVCVDEGEVDQACQLGIQALQLLGEVEYETGVQRVRDLRVKLRPWRNHPAVADLTEQLLLVS